MEFSWFKHFIALSVFWCLFSILAVSSSLSIDIFAGRFFSSCFSPIARMMMIMKGSITA